ncbi:MAG TPA: DUF4230 domain-containing protein [Roseiflexaceae bacterium]|jgi:hypothetical protein|nr:DUF4230 domain-containing protein [Roseiflexaceae bacterium]
MDPYDDDARPRRRGDDRRPNDAPPRRRDSLIERRLRAREEGEDYEDYDDYDEPAYRRSARGGYAAPAYRPSSGGGCATTALYLLLAVVVIGVVFLLAGQRLISSAASALVPNVPAKIQQVIATPTPTLRDRGGTIQQIRSLNRLETKSFSVERVIEASVQRGNPLDLLLGDRLLLIASGTVVAGVDLSKLTPADVIISPDGESITVHLPPSEIFSKALDNERTRVYDRSSGILAPQNKDLETQARQQAESEILNAACEGGIMQQAADEAQRSLEQFLKLLDFQQVTVTATAGQCVAPATVPTVAPAAPAPTP